jgi:hypothetical protein
VASDPTVSRLVTRPAADAEDVLVAIAAARAAARERVWSIAGAPVQEGRVVIDLDATLVPAHSDKQDATRTSEEGFRVPSVAGVRRSRHRQWWGAGLRAAAAGEGRLEHRRRSRRGARRRTGPAPRRASRPGRGRAGGGAARVEDRSGRRRTPDCATCPSTTPTRTASGSPSPPSPRTCLPGARGSRCPPPPPATNPNGCGCGSSPPQDGSCAPRGAASCTSTQPGAEAITTAHTRLCTLPVP